MLLWFYKLAKIAHVDEFSSVRSSGWNLLSQEVILIQCRLVNSWSSYFVYAHISCIKSTMILRVCLRDYIVFNACVLKYVAANGLYEIKLQLFFLCTFQSLKTGILHTDDDVCYPTFYSYVSKLKKGVVWCLFSLSKFGSSVPQAQKYHNYNHWL